VRESGITLILVQHLSKWSSRLAFDDLSHGGDGEEWRGEKSEEFITIKGMLNKPDIQLNATINQWIAVILLFDFNLMHIPSDKHSGPDGLLHRPHMDDGNVEDSEDVEDWINVAGGFTIGIHNQMLWQSSPAILAFDKLPTSVILKSKPCSIFSTSSSSEVVSPSNPVPVIPRSEKVLKCDVELTLI
jgi:hypothetical protein